MAAQTLEMNGYMKALVFQGVQEPLLYRDDYPVSTPPEGWTLVRVAYAAINRRDIWIRQGLYAGIKAPCILGSDACGYCEGQRVVINPGLFWGENPEYQSRDFRVLGMPDDGTFADYVAVPRSNIYPAPSHLDDVHAAALPLAGVTAYRALFTRGKLQPQHTVLITGIGGGVAHLAMKMAIAIGAKVYVSSSRPSYIQQAVEEGAAEGVNYRDGDWDKQLKQMCPDGFDLIIDSAGGDAFARLVRLLRYGGRLVTYGGTLGPVNGLSPQVIFWKQLNIVGSTMGSDADFQAMLELVERHRITPDVGKVFPLQQGEEAFQWAWKGGRKKSVLLIR